MFKTLARRCRECSTQRHWNLREPGSDPDNDPVHDPNPNAVPDADTNQVRELARTKGSMVAKKMPPTASMSSTATATYSGPPCVMLKSSTASKASNPDSILHGSGWVVETTHGAARTYVCASIAPQQVAGPVKLQSNHPSRDGNVVCERAWFMSQQKPTLVSTSAVWKINVVSLAHRQARGVQREQPRDRAQGQASAPCDDHRLRSTERSARLPSSHTRAGAGQSPSSISERHLRQVPGRS